MNNFKKIAVGALMLAGATLGVAVPANAGVAPSAISPMPATVVTPAAPATKRLTLRLITLCVPSGG